MAASKCGWPCAVHVNSVLGSVLQVRIRGKRIAPVQGHRPEIATMNYKPIAGVKIMERREDYQALMEKQLNAWKAQTESFKATAERIEGHAKAQYEKNLEMLRAKQGEAWEYFYKLKGANETAWAQFKAQMDKAGGEVKDAVERMTTKFKQ
jgi:hypothetical protein